MTEQIDPRVRMGVVTLTVANLERSLKYYLGGIGLRPLQRDEQSVVLGAGDTPLVRLIEQPGARIVRRVTGLYHFALLLPSRLELARTIRHLADTGTPVDGASDHLVSEALYLSDPDGHGIEIYRDRVRQRWYDDSGAMRMDTLPLDIPSILGELEGNGTPWNGIHADTVMGHVHLHVDNIASADDFYIGLLGFAKPFSGLNIPSASFVSAGGYHHHLGLNTWAGVGAPPPPKDAARLLHYEVLFPDEDALEQPLERLKAAGVPVSREDGVWQVSDPAGNRLLLKVG